MLAVCLTLAALMAYLWVVGGSVEYELAAPATASSEEQLRAINALNDRVGCELWGRPIHTRHGWIARFRFPNEIESEELDCLRRASGNEFEIRKASWLQTKLHSSKPSWL
jgi:hypothetical protein